MMQKILIIYIVFFKDSENVCFICDLAWQAFSVDFTFQKVTLLSRDHPPFSVHTYL